MDNDTGRQVIRGKEAAQGVHGEEERPALIRPLSSKPPSPTLCGDQNHLLSTLHASTTQLAIVRLFTHSGCS